MTLVSYADKTAKTRTTQTKNIEFIADKMKTLLAEYNAKEEKAFEDILDFHVKFERIHPFQDGNTLPKHA